MFTDVLKEMSKFPYKLNLIWMLSCAERNKQILMTRLILKQRKWWLIVHVNKKKQVISW